MKDELDEIRKDNADIEKWIEEEKERIRLEEEERLRLEEEENLKGGKKKGGKKKRWSYGNLQLI